MAVLLGVPTHDSSAKVLPCDKICLMLSVVRWGTYASSTILN